MCEPTDRSDVLTVATPAVSATGDPKSLPSILNCTFPDGVPDPGAEAVTVAVNVTDWPKVDGVKDEITRVVVAGLLTVNAAFCVVVLFACTWSLAVKLALMVCVPAGAVIVTVTWQLAVPTGLLPCARVHVVNVSELFGLLVSANKIVPAGVETVPPALASATVTVNRAVPPMTPVPVSGEMNVVVVRVFTWIPLCVPVMLPVSVSVAVKDRVPAVFKVALNV